MSKKKHIYPNGTKVQVYFDGSPVWTGKIVDHDIEIDDDDSKTQNLYYKVEIKRTDFEKMLGLDKYHWLNDFEVKPVKWLNPQKNTFYPQKQKRQKNHKNLWNTFYFRW